LTVALVLDVPPGPEQESEYEVAVDRGPVLCVPPTPTAPLHAPEAVQEVALLEVHSKVAALTGATAAGDAVNVTTVAGRIERVARAGEEIPPGPVQLSK
jgi:hypothetical protein